MLSHLCMGGRVPAQPNSTHSCKNSKLCAAPSLQEPCSWPATPAVQSAMPCVKLLQVALPLSQFVHPLISRCLVRGLFCLQEEYELIIPRGGPVSSHKKSVREAGLVPSALLHFKHGQTAQRVPALTPELLATAQPAPS